MIALCVILIIAAAGFGSREVVNVFGYNIYIVQAEGFEKAPRGSAVIVKKSAAFDVEAGKLILYQKGGDAEQFALGYVRETYVSDGVYYLSVTDNVSSIEVPESRLVGTADYSSTVVGSALEFIKTPFGIFCVAVMPCLALILYDIIHAAALNRPEPEVEPQLKNRYEEVVTQKNISVKGSGEAAYSGTRSGKPNTDAGDVLFNYSSPKRSVRRDERPIIPLTDKKSDTSEPAEAPREAVPINSAQSSKRVNHGIIAGDAPRTPDRVGVSRYISNSREGGAVGDKTAELPNIKSRDTGDAFFAQTTSTSASIPKNGLGTGSSEQLISPRAVGRQAPQIGRQASKRGADEEINEPTVHRTSGRRSTQILASKRVEDLISDDDDDRSQKRYNDDVGDGFFSEINNRKDS